MREAIRAATDADFLAALPGLTGFTAHESVVVALFRGRLAIGAFRLGLPGTRRTAEFCAIAEFIVQTAQRSAGVDRVCPVVCTDDTFRSAHGIPWADLADEVTRRLRGSRLAVAGFFCVAGDGWGDYLERRPAVRHDLAEIAASPLAVPVDALDDLELLPLVPAGERTAVRKASQAALASTGPIVDVGLLLEDCLESDAVEARSLSLLALAMRRPADRDRVALQAAFGALVGDAVAEQNAAFHALQQERGGSMDDIVREELDAGRLRRDDEIDGLFLGRGRIRPDRERMTRAAGLLAKAVVCLDPDDRLAPLCVLTWLSWAGGLGSVAWRYLDLAREIDPGYSMALLLADLIRHVPFPDWALPQE